MKSYFGCTYVFFMKPFCKLTQNLTRAVTNISLGIIHLIRTQIFRKTSISCPVIFKHTCVYQGVTNISFFRKCCVRTTWMILYSKVFKMKHCVKCVQIRTRKNSVFGHFSRSETLSSIYQQ